MIIKVCDAFWRQSPDEHGGYIANAWITAEIHQPKVYNFSGQGRDFSILLCVECFDRLKAAFHPDGREVNVFQVGETR